MSQAKSFATRIGSLIQHQEHRGLLGQLACTALAHRASCVGALSATCRSYGSSAGGEDARRQLLRKHLLVDTMELESDFEDAGMQRADASRLARKITELIIENKLKMEEAFVKQATLEKVILEQTAKIQGFKTELQKAQDMHHAAMDKDLEQQQSYLDKMKAEVRHEIDKLTASQRLDMNLEKGRMRDELMVIRDKTTDLQIKVDREINELKSSVEKAKNDTIKSVITILGTFSAIAFTISRFIQMSGGG
ncbi:hypothetical protein Agub_g9497 [Astrephomene gubernaculifera]|uniref:Uncharacterized protein n=1 Tax=Astrephomene gubernaculifera TaxID=47775 RepID=A0AAD3HP10_9CHLO|nr:hypothetical protein Agub_g9497 [Astrephomene gubernaculifera]